VNACICRTPGVSARLTIMADTTPRLLRRIERDFPQAGSASAEASIVSAVDSERVQAAVVLWGRGDLARIRDACDLALTDWRDALVRADLADEDWAERLDAELGTQ
jgi:hypothetical protein